MECRTEGCRNIALATPEGVYSYCNIKERCCQSLRREISATKVSAADLTEQAVRAFIRQRFAADAGRFECLDDSAESLDIVEAAALCIASAVEDAVPGAEDLPLLTITDIATDWLNTADI